MNETTDELPKMLTAKIIRERVLPMGRRTMQRYLAAGKFPAPDMALGGKQYWQREKVLEWLAQQQAATA